MGHGELGGVSGDDVGVRNQVAVGTDGGGDLLVTEAVLDVGQWDAAGDEHGCVGVAGVVDAGLGRIFAWVTAGCKMRSWNHASSSLPPLGPVKMSRRR